MLRLNFVSDWAQVVEIKYVASCNISAVNNNPLEDFSFEIFVFS